MTGRLGLSKRRANSFEKEDIGEFAATVGKPTVVVLFTDVFESKALVIP